MLGTVIESVLLHGHLRVAQEVLLLGKFSLGIKNLKVEIAVAQSQDDVALLHACAFLHNLFSHDASLFGRDLHHLNRHYLSVKPHIVVELTTSNVANGHVGAIDSHGACRTAEDKPRKQGSYGNSPRTNIDVAARK